MRVGDILIKNGYVLRIDRTIPLRCILNIENVKIKKNISGPPPNPFVPSRHRLRRWRDKRNSFLAKTEKHSRYSNNPAGTA